MTAAREWFEKDYYEVLGVASDAEAKDITRAYRKLARRFHPDANAGDEQAEERFKEVAAAYDVVGDPHKRADYDEIRALGPMGHAGGFGTSGFRPGADGGSRVRPEDVGDFGDLFSGLFGRSPKRRGGAGSPTGGGAAAGGRGEDLETELHLSFADAVTGVTTTVNVVSGVLCGSCRGSGAAPGTAPSACQRCDGRGLLDDNQGFFSFSQPCSTCRGTGQTIDHPCPACAGIGVERRPRDVKVRVPAGIEDGQRIKLAGRGGPGRGGGPAGDLLVTVRVSPHERFGRRERDLTLTVAISYPEAVLGTEVHVLTLEGGSLTLRVPPATPSGRTFRVRGRGIATPAGTGDLLVAVEIAVPANPSARERKLLEELARLGAADTQAQAQARSQA